MAQLNLTTIFQKAFGYAPPDNKKFEVPQAPARVETSSLGQPYYATDILGREFFMPVRFQGAIVIGALIQPFDFLVPFATISAVEKKTIVETPMPQRGGAVNELISLDDYLFTIKGVFVSDDNTFPEDGVKSLHDIFSVNQSITVHNVITDIFLNGLFENRILIKEIKWPSADTIENAQAFQIEAKSDMIFTLETQE